MRGTAHHELKAILIILVLLKTVWTETIQLLTIVTAVLVLRAAAFPGALVCCTTYTAS